MRPRIRNVLLSVAYANKRDICSAADVTHARRAGQAARQRMRARIRQVLHGVAGAIWCSEFPPIYIGLRSYASADISHNHGRVVATVAVDATRLSAHDGLALIITDNFGLTVSSKVVLVDLRNNALSEWRLRGYGTVYFVPRRQLRRRQ